MLQVTKLSIKLGSGPEIEALQIGRLVTTSTINKLSFLNADMYYECWYEYVLLMRMFYMNAEMYAVV